MANRLIQLAFLFTLIVASSLHATPPGYWQQEVNYKIDVVLQSDLRTITGTCHIEYINNSPDTLRELYIKAFPNAVQKGSFADKKARETGDYSFANLTFYEQGSLEIDSLQVHYIPNRVVYVETHDPIEGEKPTLPRWTFDNTIVAVDLSPQPTLPNDTTRISIHFTTTLPSPHSMRMGLYGGVTKAAYWYPQVCVYDRKIGWNNGQYLGWGECYGDYGRFEVSITAPEDIVVAATGYCWNQDVVLPESLKTALELNNYLKPRSDWPKLKYDISRTKRWEFAADNVNDFAFVASRDYCISWDTSDAVDVIAYVLKRNAQKWKTATQDGIDAITTLSEKFFPYQYPVMRICDAYGGMEFPMLVHCAGGPPSPGWYIVTYHEIAHNWFMGMIGSNQTDRPFLDEGFTTHAEHVVMEKYRGRYDNVSNPQGWYARAFAPDDEVRNTRGFRPLLELMTEKYDKPMVFSYDQGEEYWPYRVSAYYKTAAMHYNLRAILGDSAYFAAMQHYCREWLFSHPYEEDFVEAMEQATGLQLDPFFQQWFYGRERLDYGVKSVKRKTDSSDSRTEITLENRGRFVTPVPVAVILENGDTLFYTAAPEGMTYARPGYTTLPTWHQFRRFDEKYTFTVNDSRKVKKVVVDPENLLMDIDRTNNISGFFWPTEIRFDNMKYDRVPVNEYALRWRPDLWYDKPNGMQIGGHLHGSYLGKLNKFSLDTRYGVESKRPFVDLEGSLPIVTLGSGPDFSYRLLLADHRLYTRSSYFTQSKPLWSRPDREELRFDMEMLKVGDKQTSPRGAPDPDILPYITEPNWDSGETYSFSVSTGIYRTFRYGEWSITDRSTVGMHDYEESARGFLKNEIRANLSLKRSGDSGGNWLSTRFVITNLGGHPPAHLLQHLTRASAYDQFVQSQMFRSPGSFPTDWQDDFYHSAERVRGYQDRLVYLAESYGGSVELTPFKRLPIPLIEKTPFIGIFLSKANLTLFADGATVSMEEAEPDYRFPVTANETVLNEGKFYASGGFSITLPPVWSHHSIRLDFPVFLSKPLPSEERFDFRFSVAWLKSI